MVKSSEDKSLDHMFALTALAINPRDDDKQKVGEKAVNQGLVLQIDMLGNLKISVTLLVWVPFLNFFYCKHIKTPKIHLN